MAEAVKAVPEGHHTVTPGICVRGADRALEFYQQAFGAQVSEDLAPEEMAKRQQAFFASAK